MGISGGEVFFVLLAVLVLFGADKIPELVRSFGKGMNEFKKAADEIKRELSDAANDLQREVSDLSRDITQEVRNVGQDIKTDFDPYKDLTSENTSPSTTTSETEASGSDELPKPEIQKTISRKKR
jgi:sec-independent protein translocase protein TatA